MSSFWEDELLDDEGGLDPDGEPQEPRIFAVLEGVVFERNEETGQVIAILDSIAPQGTLWLEPAQRGYLPPLRGDRVLVMFKQGKKEHGIYWPLGAEEGADQRMVRGDALWAWMQSVSSHLSELATWNKNHAHMPPTNNPLDPPITGRYYPDPSNLHPTAPTAPTESSILSTRWRIK